MPRIRSVHPGQWTDEAFVSVSMAARLLAVAVRNVADDQGVFDWKPITLKMQLFPADAVDVAALLSELQESGQIAAFEAGGKKYGAVRNFRRWQRPEKPKPVHPLPDDLRLFVGLSAPACGTGADPSPTNGASDPNKQQTVNDQSPTAPRPVGDQSGNSSAEVGGRRVEEGGNSSSLREEAAPEAAASKIENGSDLLGEPPARPCARTALFREGLEKLIAMTGRSERSLRAWLGGRVLLAVEDDAALVLSLIQDAHRRWMSQDQELAEPVSWITGQVKLRVEAMSAGRVVRLNPGNKPQAETAAPAATGSAAWHRKQAEERAARARAKAGANGAHSDHPNVIDGEAEPVEAHA